MRNIVPQKKKEEKKTSPKGFGPPQPATEAHQKLILKRKKKIEKKLGGNVEFTGKFEAVSYKRTVAGHTDEIVIDVGEEQWVRITVVQKASGSYMLWDAHWFTPDKEVEVGQIEVDEQIVEENQIEGKAKVMERKKVQESPVVEKIEQAQQAAVQASQPNTMQIQMGNKGPKKAKQPMQIKGSSPQPQIVHTPIQQGNMQMQASLPQGYTMVNQPKTAQQNYQPIQQNYQPIQQNYQPVQQSYQPLQQNYRQIQPKYQPVQQNYQQMPPSNAGLLHVKVIDNAYAHKQSQGQAANEMIYHPRQVAAPQAPQVLFVKTINPF